MSENKAVVDWVIAKNPRCICTGTVIGARIDHAAPRSGGDWIVITAASDSEIRDAPMHWHKYHLAGESSEPRFVATSFRDLQLPVWAPNTSPVDALVLTIADVARQKRINHLIELSAEQTSGAIAIGAALGGARAKALSTQMPDWFFSRCAGAHRVSTTLSTPAITSA